jgi:hypothetical protein
MMEEFTLPGPCLTPMQLSQRWKKHEGTLRRWRKEGVGPKWIKLPPGSGVGNRASPFRYPLADLLAYELTHGITPLD